MVFFDLPTETKEDRKIHALFRKDLISNGFMKFQYSVYIRHCLSRENMIVHINRVKRFLPEKGHIVILTVTDKQFGMMENFFGKQKVKNPEGSQQLSLF